ncbi:hypothetical protein D9M73_228230 [compost metagenome]
MDGQLGAGRKTFDVAFEFSAAEQEAQFHLIPALARMATGEGGHALGHQFDADPGRQAAVGEIEQAIGLDGQAGVNLLFIERQDLIDQDHVAGVGQQFGERPVNHGASPIIRLTLLPPKAKELLIR